MGSAASVALKALGTLTADQVANEVVSIGKRFQAYREV